MFVFGRLTFQPEGLHRVKHEGQITVQFYFSIKAILHLKSRLFVVVLLSCLNCLKLVILTQQDLFYSTLYISTASEHSVMSVHHLII